MTHRAFNKQEFSRLVKRIVRTYDDDRGINHIEGLPIPDRTAILRMLEDVHFVLFPGFTTSRPVSHNNIEYMVGDALDAIFATLAQEVETAFHYQCKLERCDTCNCQVMAEKAAALFLKELPRIREVLKTDVEAAFNGDPAAGSFDEIILSYPGVQAISMHRIAHELYRIGVPLIPRIIAEHAHSTTGIDIHPGATIGKSFFIDHGTGVVIGETSVIGWNVKVYMGVTLGALAPAKGQSLRGVKRHPTIEDDVTIYAGATILGGETVIGKGSTIGGNVWLPKSVPPYTKVVLSNPELVFLGKKKPTPKAGARSKDEWRCPAKEICESEAGKLDKPCGDSCPGKASAQKTAKKLLGSGKKTTRRKR